MRTFTPSAVLALLLSALVLASAPARAQSSDIVIDKTGPATADAGSDVTYTVTIANNGPNDAGATSFFDIVAPGTTLVSFNQNSGAPFACSPSAGNELCTNANFLTGQSASFTVVVHIDPAYPAGATITNTVGAFSTSAEASPGNESDTVVTTVTTSADLSASKSGPPTVVPGVPGTTYTLSVANNGPSDALNVAVTDPMPAGTTFSAFTQDTGPVFTCATPAFGANGTITCFITALPTGATATFTLVVDVASSVPDGTVLNNLAGIGSASTPDPVPGNNVALTSATATAAADVTVAKFAPASEFAGNNMTYTVLVVNNGPSDAVNFAWSDPLPAGTTFLSGNQTGGPAMTCTVPPVGANGTVGCTLASFVPGVAASFDVVVHIGSSVPLGSTLTNVATVSTTTPDPNGGNNSASASTNVLVQADIGVTKTGPATVDAGTDITYNIGAGNAGPSDSPSFNISDPIPPGTTFVSASQTVGPAFTCSLPPVGGTGTVSCDIANLAPSQFGVFTVVVHVLANVAPGGTLSNTASVTSTAPDTATGNNSSTASAIITATADLSVVKNGPATIVAGNDITYTLTVANAGPSNATSVALSDALPPATTFVSNTQNSGPAFACTTPAIGSNGTVTCSIPALAPGASAAFTLVANVSSATASGASVVNTATASTATPDGAAGNNSSTSTATVTASADLVVTKTGPASTSTGTTLTYNLSILNSGPSDALNVSLTDVLPAGTTYVSNVQNTGPAFTCTVPAVGANGTVACTIASLSSGGGATFTLVVQAGASLIGGSVVSNTATGATTTTDPTPGNNSQTATTNILAITSFTGPSATGSGTITATFVGGGPACAFTNAAFIAVSGAPGSPPAGSAPAGVAFPHGLFTFTTSGCVPGSTLAFTITYPAPVERAQYWKYGPTPGHSTAHWYVLPATLSGPVATFSITDGGVGDDDLTANGTIVDQGGPGFGGSASIPTLSEWMQLLLGALLLAMGMRAVRRRGRA